MVEREGALRAAEPVDPGSGYRLDARGRQQAETIGWGFWKMSSTRFPFERCGLVNIRDEATADVVRGGSPWARWWQATLEAIRSWE
jgi:hypothetical protein